MLEIELITTKKKLTLSLVKQMPQLPKCIVAMQRCEVLGHIHHPSLDKGLPKVLVKYNGVYYVLPLYKWYSNGPGDTLYVKLGGGWSTKKVFSNQRERDEWLELFELIKTKALTTHIYL